MKRYFTYIFSYIDGRYINWSVDTQNLKTTQIELSVWRTFIMYPTALQQINEESGAVAEKYCVSGFPKP